MEQLKLSLIILVLVSVAFAQEQPIDQTKEFDIAQIREKAKTDALSDFNPESNVGWCGLSVLLTVGTYLSIPIAAESKNPAFTVASLAGLVALSTAAYVRKVNMPENRERDISSKGQEYGTIYRSEYDLIVKMQRFKYTLLGPAVLGLAAGFGVVRNLVLEAQLTESESTEGEDE